MGYGTGSITANVMADSAVSLLNDNASPDDGNPLSLIASPQFLKENPCQESFTHTIRIVIGGLACARLWGKGTECACGDRASLLWRGTG